MDKLEKVIKGLKYLHDRETWKEGSMVYDDKPEERRKITADALALLKSQQPMEPARDGSGSLICGNQDYGCGVVGTYDVETGEVKERWVEYCPHCGKKVKWDG